MIERIRLWIAAAVDSPHFGWVSTTAITLLGATLRFANLANPQVLTFDETYYVKDAYTLGLFGSERRWPEGANADFEAGNTDVFLDQAQYVVHPPIGKWLIWLGMALFGADSSFGWRFSVAAVGTLLIPLLIFVARLMFGSKFWAVAAGLALAIEGQAIVLSRTSILDGLLAFFVLAGFAFFLIDLQRTRARLKAYAAGGLRLRVGLRPWLAATGVALGVAGGIKWSALYVLAGFGLYSVISETLLRRRLARQNPLTGLALQGSLSFISLVPAAGLTYLLGWLGWITSTDGWGRQAEPGWLASLFEYHKNAYGFHTGLATAHPYEANAFAWLLNLRPTAIYFESFDQGSDGCLLPGGCTVAITALPHPLIWFGGVLAILWLALRLFTRRGRADQTGGLILLGFAVGWVPWLFYLNRTTFQFYSIIFEPFLILALIYALSRWRRNGLLNNRLPARDRALVWLLVAALVMLVFFLSLWMGLATPQFFWRLQMWLPIWI